MWFVSLSGGPIKKSLTMSENTSLPSGEFRFLLTYFAKFIRYIKKYCFALTKGMLRKVEKKLVTRRQNVRPEPLIHFCDLCVDTTDMLILGDLTKMILLSFAACVRTFTKPNYHTCWKKTKCMIMITMKPSTIIQNFMPFVSGLGIGAG